jgi:hypothetical protein
MKRLGSGEGPRDRKTGRRGVKEAEEEYGETKSNK